MPKVSGDPIRALTTGAEGAHVPNVATDLRMWLSLRPWRGQLTWAIVSLAEKDLTGQG